MRLGPSLEDEEIRIRAEVAAGVAQLVEQLICNQQVAGSSPITSSKFHIPAMDEYPSGQRGQAVNLLAVVFEGSNPSSSTSVQVWLVS